jgi:saccharopine dehydrogenase-like NADP-dependent oxidoreductase
MDKNDNNLKKAVIFGVGRMGTSISWYMNKLGYHVVGVDAMPSACERLKGMFGEEKFGFYRTKHADQDCDQILDLESPDVVISSLPYHQTEAVAKVCVDKGLRYCDLGGRVDVSRRINEYANDNATKPIMTDLGLAPGWVNILAEQGFREVARGGQVQSIKMMVGGLPVEKLNHPLDYAITWSVDGLINEYKDNCEIIKNGKIETVAGMDGLEIVDSEYLGPLEAFYTSGGSSHTIKTMQERDVVDCAYKTLRYPGHIETVKFLMKDCGLSDEQMAEIFNKGCNLDIPDLVIIKAYVKKGDLLWNKEILVNSIKDEFSAMQRATSGPISVVASLMAEGMFDARFDEHRDYKVALPLVLSYKDVPYEEFNKRLTTLGIL